MAVNTAPLLSALERPTVWIPRRWPLSGVRRYQGRLLSHQEFLPFAEDFAQVEALSEREVLELFARYLKAIGIPPRVVLRLPTAAMLEVMDDFLGCQRAATVPVRKKSIPGKRSRPKAKGS